MMPWPEMCFWCRGDFNGEVIEYDKRFFHPQCRADYIVSNRAKKEEGDEEVRKSLESVSVPRAA